MKWRKIENEKPEPNQDIFVKNQYGYVSGQRDKDDEDGVWAGSKLCYISEWMPIEEFENAFGKTEICWAEHRIDTFTFERYENPKPEFFYSEIAKHIVHFLMKEKKIKFTRKDYDHFYTIRGQLTVVDPQGES